MNRLAGVAPGLVTVLHSVRIGLLAGAAISVSVTAFICTWEWLENPGGIFRDDTGTNWRFVYDTGISWLVPTFLVAFPAAGGVHLLFRWLTSGIRHREEDNP